MGVDVVSAVRDRLSTSNLSQFFSHYFAAFMESFVKNCKKGGRPFPINHMPLASVVEGSTTDACRTSPDVTSADVTVELLRWERLL